MRILRIVLAAMMAVVLASGCSSTDDDMNGGYMPPVEDASLISGTYEGEWTLNGVRGEAAVLTVEGDQMLFTSLPCRLLTELLLTVTGIDTGKNSPEPLTVEVTDEPFTAAFTTVGASPGALYLASGNPEYDFPVSIGGKDYTMYVFIHDKGLGTANGNTWIAVKYGVGGLMAISGKDVIEATFDEPVEMVFVGNSTGR